VQEREKERERERKISLFISSQLHYVGFRLKQKECTPADHLLREPLLDLFEIASPLDSEESNTFYWIFTVMR